MARPLKRLKPKQITAQVRRIRGRNNRLWMSLMDLAVAAKPRKAKAIIHKIVANDLLVSKWMNRL